MVGDLIVKLRIIQFGDTPLHFAVFHQDHDLVQALIDLKADHTKTNNVLTKYQNNLN